VRGLATGSIDPHRFLNALLREGRVGLSLGAIYGVLLGAVAFVWQGTAAGLDLHDEIVETYLGG